jgi:SAM-dependent methyltransferase
MTSPTVNSAGDSCPLCGSIAWTLVDTQRDLLFPSEELFQIVRCHDCRLMYTVPRMSVEELSRYYPAAYNEYADDVETLAADYDPLLRRIDSRAAWYGHFLYREIHGTAVRRIAASAVNSCLRLGCLLYGVHAPDLLPLKNGPGRYLHIGSGKGGRFLALLRKGWEVAAVDVNPELMRRWRTSKVALTTFGEGIQRASFEPASFDVIYMTHVLEHLADPVGDLSALNRWLKPDGTLICEVPLYGTLGWSLRPRYTYYDVPRHTMHFTAETFAAILRRSGFEIRQKVTVPYGWGFFFSSFKRFHMTGRPDDCSRLVNVLPMRHRVLGWLSWLAGSTGNLCVYAVKTGERAQAHR